MGIAPYSHKDRDIEHNFLYQLQQNKMIDHLIISFYTNSESQSSIKFGSWDEEGVKDGSSLEMLKTDSESEWKVRLWEVIAAGE